MDSANRLPSPSVWGRRFRLPSSPSVNRQDRKEAEGRDARRETIEERPQSRWFAR
jgi:hypothetical protein